MGDDDTALRHEIAHITQAEGKTVVGPDGIGDPHRGMAKALQAGKIIGFEHDSYI